MDPLEAIKNAAKGTTPPATSSNDVWKKSIREVAESVASFYGVPWQILAGIATLESGWGKKLSAPHNYCGMKWSEQSLERAYKPVTTEEDIGPRNVKIKASFIEFRSLDHCIAHLAKKLRFQGAYSKFQKRLDAGDSIDKLALALQGVYATDEEYAKKLTAVIASLEK